MRRLTAVAIAVLTLPAVAAAPDAGGDRPACTTTVAGTAGTVVPTGEVGLTEPGPNRGEPAPPEVASTLPAVLAFRGNTETYTAEYYFAVRDGRIWIKDNVETTDIVGPWRAMDVPSCLDGRVAEISADGNVLLVVDDERWIYTRTLHELDPATVGWTHRWGPYFWSGLGIQLPADVSDWATSEFTPEVDEYYEDRAGNRHEPFGILTGYLLRGDGRRITYIDPWLPADESREVCGPDRGSRRLAGLSGSGSTVLAVTSDGELYTRLYEFDVSGANTVFFDYAWSDQSEVEEPRMQLPAPDWLRHEPPPGVITDRVSLRKLPPGTAHRLLRVEGVGPSGRTGYWEKDQADPGVGAWHFVATDQALRGRRLPLAGPHELEGEDARWVGVVDGVAAELIDLNPYCSPARLRLRFGPGRPLDLLLHTVDGLRQEERARGLDGEPRHYRGALEVPAHVWARRDRLGAETKAFLEAHFPDGRFVAAPLDATTTRVQLVDQCWSFRPWGGSDEAAGLRPRRPDLGSEVSRGAAAIEQQRTPGSCRML